MAAPKQLLARFKPGSEVSAFAKTTVAAGRFVKIVDDKTTDGSYQIGHCGAGDHAFGVSQHDSAASTEPATDARRLVNVARRGAIARVEPGGAITAGSEVMSDASGKAVSAAVDVAAALDTGVVGSNNAIHWQAKDPGADGNLVSVTIVDPGGATATLGVVVSGPDITVNLGRAASAINSTAQAVIAAIQASSPANALVSVTNKGASTGLGLVAAVAKTQLAGGTNATAPAAGHVLGEACHTVASDAPFVEVDLY